MGAPGSLSAAQIAGLACMMEVVCPKPGNVSPGRPFRYINGMTFLASALGLAAAFGDGRASVGRMVEAAALLTKEWVDRNTNIGMILLLAPLVRAAGSEGGLSRESVRAVLDALNDDDARRVCGAICAAAPEGLGSSERYDVRSEVPPLLEAMALASGWDSVAGEYASGYEITFGTVPSLLRLWREGRCLKDCILQTYLALLADVPDTLIARKLGREAAVKVSTEARAVVKVGGAFTAEGRERIAAFGASLSHPDNLLNPGTTADLTAAAIFVFLTDELPGSGLPYILQRWEDDAHGGE